MALVKVAFVVLVGVFVLAPEAVAIEPGVVYEPGSPAGKEYALPLEEARRDAGSPGSEGEAPSYEAFGVGVQPPGGDGGESGRGGDSDRGGHGEGDGGGTRGAGDGPAGERADTPVSRAGLADAESAGGSSGWTLLIILAVLVPGALIGFGLGRLPRGGAGHGPRKTSASRGAQRSTE